MSTDSLQLNVTPELLKQLFGEIAVLDAKIAEAGGSEAAGKRAIANGLATEHTDSWTGVSTQVVEHFKDQSIEVKIAALTGITKALRDAYGEETDKFLTEAAEANKKDAPEVSDDELNGWMDERREKNEQFKMVKGLLELFGQDVSGIEDPKRMTGSRGKRGPRTFGKYDWFVKVDDGEYTIRTKKQNSLSSIANTICKPLGWKTAQLKDHIVAVTGIDLNEPPAEVEFDLPEINGKNISVKAVKNESKADDDDNGDDDDDDDDDDTVTPDETED